MLTSTEIVRIKCAVADALGLPNKPTRDTHYIKQAWIDALGLPLRDTGDVFVLAATLAEFLKGTSGSSATRIDPANLSEVSGYGHDVCVHALRINGWHSYTHWDQEGYRQEVPASLFD